MLYILDATLVDMDVAIAAHTPERGGALLGPIGLPIVSRFVFDHEAQTTTVTYSPSRKLAAQVQEIERRENLEYKGIVHSHPGALDHPSGQDERELRVGLELNPQMPFYLAPIITLAKPFALFGKMRRLHDHETPLGSGKISFFAAHRTRSGVQVQPMPIEVLSAEELMQKSSFATEPLGERTSMMQQDIEKVREILGGGDPDFFTTELEGVSLTAVRMTLEGDLELLFLYGEGYPVAPPLLLATPKGGNTEQVPLSWSLQVSNESRLVESLSHIFSGSGPFLKAFGTSSGLAMSNRPAQARLAGWTPLFVSQSTLITSYNVQSELFARVVGVLSPEIRDKTALVVGLGSVGSYLTEQLTRSGLGGFVLIDPEVVESANLSRSVYELNDVGKSKTEALIRRLWNINPALRLQSRTMNLLDFNEQELDQLICNVDIVIGATDDLAAQRALNRFAYANGKAAIFIGLYAGANGGEVILSLPEQTPCYQCATSTRHEMEQETVRVSADLDYGSGRLVGEVALGADIQHITSAAVKMALSLLMPPHSEAKLKDYLTPAIKNQMSYFTLSTVPQYWFYPMIFGKVDGQFAYQSVWLTPTRNPDCPVCGNSAHRVAPCEVPLRAPKLSDLRNLDPLASEAIEGGVKA